MAFCCKKAVGIAMCISMLLAIQRPLFAQRRQGYTLSELADSAARHLPAILQKQALVSGAQANVTDARHAAFTYLETI